MCVCAELSETQITAKQHSEWSWREGGGGVVVPTGENGQLQRREKKKKRRDEMGGHKATGAEGGSMVSKPRRECV